MYTKQQKAHEKPPFRTAAKNGESAAGPLAPVVQKRSFYSVVAAAPGRAEHPPPPNRTGIPARLKGQYESAAGLSLDDVRVHYNSPKPAKLRALAYTQGAQVYIGPGQERHLSHELGHVVQQKSGLVRPTGSLSGLPVNDDPALERQADAFPSQHTGQAGFSGAAPVVQRLRGDLAAILAQGDRMAIAQTCLDLFQRGDAECREFLDTYLSGGAAETDKHYVVRSMLGQGLERNAMRVIADCVSRAQLALNFKYYVNCLFALNQNGFHIRIFIYLLSRFLNPFWDFAIEYHRAAVLANNGELIEAVLIDALNHQRVGIVQHIIIDAGAMGITDNVLFSDTLLSHKPFTDWVVMQPAAVMGPICQRIFDTNPVAMLAKLYPLLLGLNDFQGCAPIFTVLFQQASTPLEAMDALLQTFGAQYLNEIAQFSLDDFLETILDFYLSDNEQRALQFLAGFHQRLVLSADLIWNPDFISLVVMLPANTMVPLCLRIYGESSVCMFENYYPLLITQRDFQECIPIYTVLFQNPSTPPKAMSVLLQTFGLQYLDEIAQFSLDDFMETILKFILSEDQERALRFLVDFHKRIPLNMFEGALLAIQVSQPLFPLIDIVFTSIRFQFSGDFWSGSRAFFTGIIGLNVGDDAVYRLISAILQIYGRVALDALVPVMQAHILARENKTITGTSLAAAIHKMRADPHFIKTILHLPTWEYINKLGLYVCKYDGDRRIAFVKNGDAYVCVGFGSYHDKSGYGVGNKFNYDEKF